MSLLKLRTNKSLFVDITPCSSSSSSPPTLLFLHGLGSSHSFYEAPLSLVPELKEKYRVVRYDFDGHGLSPVSEGPAVTIEALAEDAKAVLDELGVTRAGVVGHSMSGIVALTLAAKYPDLVSDLFLIGPIKAPDAATKDVMLTRASTVRQSGLEALVSSITASALSAHTKSTSPLSAALVRTLVLGTKVEGYARACEAIASARDPDWDRITARTLVVRGEEDYMSKRETVELMRDKVKGAKVVETRNVGHWNAVEDPKSVADLLKEFFL